MPNKHTFTTVIHNAGGGGAFVEVPFDVEAAFGEKRPKVKALIEGVLYRGTLTRYGTKYHMLIILKEIREKIGKTFGDEIKITLEPDTAPRAVEIPPELAQAFKKEKAMATYFKSLTYSHQREYVGYISEAKQEATRLRRVAQTIEMLKKHGKERT